MRDFECVVNIDKAVNIFCILVFVFGAVAVPIIAPLCALFIALHLSELLEQNEDGQRPSAY